MLGEKNRLKSYMDQRGVLLPINNVPFTVRRIFYIFDVPSETIRGNHASKTSKFFYTMLKGTCFVELNDGENTEKYELNSGNTLYFNELVWMKLYNFSSDAMLCVLSDQQYRKEDYIDDYSLFSEIVRDLNV